MHRSKSQENIQIDKIEDEITKLSEKNGEKLYTPMDFEKELNKEQLDVVLQGDGHCLILAGAGSGKTRTITYRVAYLLEKEIPADNILLVTFTNKAAKEMIDRVSALAVETRHASSLQWAGTFHHIGFRILRRYAPLLGYKNNFI